MYRTLIFTCFIMAALTRVGNAGDDASAKASGPWRDELKRLVVLSRLVASRPALLSEEPPAELVRELSVAPFLCPSSDISACVLSRLSVVLQQQSEGLEEIFAGTQGAAIQLHFMRATDSWSDKEIENNWDVLKKWTDAVGPAVLVVGAFMLSQNSSNGAAATLIGSGAGLILVGNLGTLGQLYGGVNDTQRARIARKTINALQDIEASRQAYGEALLLYGFLDGYSNKSKKSIRAISALSKEAKDLMRDPPSPARSGKIAALCDKARDEVGSFKEAAGFTADYASRLMGLYGTHQVELHSSADRKKVEDARLSMKAFLDTYDAIIVPFLEGIPGELEVMQNIKAAVIANGIANKQYF